MSNDTTAGTAPSPAAAGTAAGPMRFHVDGWDPGYGSSVEVDDSSLDESSARINVDVEVPAAQWAPIPMSSVPQPGALLFVDGVRRNEARIWIDQPSPGPNADYATMAFCASYAAGVVCCCPGGGAHLVAANIRRGLFTTATNAVDIVTGAGTYRANLTPDDPGQSLPVLLSQALQRRLTELELITAAIARGEVVAHGVKADTDLMVIDGPLRGRQHLPRVVGFIKSHRARYLEPNLHAVVSRLGPGERSPAFLMGSSWDRHSWYLRLPCEPGAPWTGIVRLECAADLPTPAVVELANQTQMLLPKYASVEYKDTRAPQNLVPVAGLERQLRRQLGDMDLLQRALRVAAHR